MGKGRKFDDRNGCRIVCRLVIFLFKGKRVHLESDKEGVIAKQRELRARVEAMKQELEQKEASIREMEENKKNVSASCVFLNVMDSVMLVPFFASRIGILWGR